VQGLVHFHSRRTRCLAPAAQAPLQGCGQTLGLLRQEVAVDVGGCGQARMAKHLRGKELVAAGLGQSDACDVVAKTVKRPWPTNLFCDGPELVGAQVPRVDHSPDRVGEDEVLIFPSRASRSSPPRSA